MAQKTDGWALLSHIAANPDKFAACDTTAALAAMLLVRNQLVQGVSSVEDLGDLADVVGLTPLIEVIENLANYEALRLIENIKDLEDSSEKRTAQAARRRMIALLKREAARRVADAVTGGRGDGAFGGHDHPLRHHSAMGARRIRPAG